MELEKTLTPYMHAELEILQEKAFNPLKYQHSSILHVPTSLKMARTQWQKVYQS